MKAQITLFIIIGILVFGAIVLSLYLSKTLSAKQKQDTTSSEQATIMINQVQQFVQSCLEINSKEGLRMLLQQAGHIYVEDKGTDTKPADADRLGMIPYIITTLNEPVASLGLEPNPPLYPWAYYPQKITDETEPESLMPFSAYQGLPTKTQMQTTLTEYIQTTTPECAIPLFQEYMTQKGITITPEPTTVAEINIKPSTIEFKLNWTIAITYRGTGLTTTKKQFTTTEKIRLEHMRNTMHELIAKDTTIQTTSAEAKTTDLKQTPNIMIESRNEQGSLVHYTDPVGSGAYRFTIARQNRKPLIAITLHEKPEEDSCNYDNIKETIINDHFIEYTLCKDHEHEYTIRVEDPDEILVNTIFSTPNAPAGLTLTKQLCDNTLFCGEELKILANDYGEQSNFRIIEGLCCPTTP